MRVQIILLVDMIQEKRTRSKWPAADIYTHTHTHTHTCIHAHTRTHKHTHKHTLLHTHTYTYIHTYNVSDKYLLTHMIQDRVARSEWPAAPFTDTYTHTRTHTYILTSIYTHAHTHIYTDTHMTDTIQDKGKHTYTHTNIRICAIFWHINIYLQTPFKTQGHVRNGQQLPSLIHLRTHKHTHID